MNKYIAPEIEKTGNEYSLVRNGEILLTLKTLELAENARAEIETMELLDGQYLDFNEQVKRYAIT